MIFIDWYLPLDGKSRNSESLIVFLISKESWPNFNISLQIKTTEIYNGNKYLQYNNFIHYPTDIKLERIVLEYPLRPLGGRLNTDA